MIQVLGNPVPARSFLYGGYVSAEGIKRALELVGRPLHTQRRVLEFGCGSARILRWFADHTCCCEFYGSDVSAEAIEWDRENIPFGRFHVNHPEPPLPYPDNYFDSIIVVSVVTHLDEDLQLAWLAELQRVLKPGGVILISVSGEEVAASRATAEEWDTFRNKGHLYKRIQTKLHGLPDFYQDAFHSRSYIERVWTRFFRISAYITNGPLYMQDLVIGEKPDKTPASLSGEYLHVRLPFGGIKLPTFAGTVEGSELSVEGWGCFYDGSELNFDIVIDGRKVGVCRAERPRPDVAKIFPQWAAVAHSGYQLSVSARGLPAGIHRVNVVDQQSGLHCVSTYFFTN